MSRILEKWGALLYRFRWVMILCWIFIILLGGIFSTRLKTQLSGYGWDVAGSQSCQAQQLVSEGFMGRGPAAMVLLVRDPQHRVGSREYSDHLHGLVQDLSKDPAVQNIYSWLDAPEQAKNSMAGEDGNTSIAYVGLNVSEESAVDKLPDMQKYLTSKGRELGLEAYYVGTPALWADVNIQSQSGLAKVEIIVLPIVFIVLLLVFRSIAAAAAPFIITVASVFTGQGIAYLFAVRLDLSIFVTNTIVMLGLGLGIDYALFIVSRFKSELEAGKDAQAAVSKALSTSGHTILFSGITVMSAVAAIFLVPLPAIRSLALGAMIAVFVSLLTGLTLLPTVLLMLGRHINKGRLPFWRSSGKNSKLWYHWSHSIMKKPVLFIVIVVTCLLVLSMPAMSLKTFTPDAGILPGDSTVKKGFIQLEQSYGPGAASTISVVLHSSKGDITQESRLQKIDELNRTIAHRFQGRFTDIRSLLSVFSGINDGQLSAMLQQQPQSLPNDVKTLASRFINSSLDTTVIDINPLGTAASSEVRDMVRTLKEEILPQWQADSGIKAVIGGATSQGMDMNSAIQQHLLQVLVVMLLLCYGVLFITFKSVLLPLKAILMNLLSVAATYGVLVFVFAKGHGAWIFHLHPNGFIQNYIPLLLLTLLFSLSTDYEVFLLNSIKEEYTKTGNNTDSVAEGLEKTAPLITGAALLMVLVFGGFAFSNMLPIQSLGFGMAVAILIDASVVRFILVPATMRLLGNWNWWCPGRRDK